MCFAGLEVSRSKALQVSGIHRPTIRATIATAGLGRHGRRHQAVRSDERLRRFFGRADDAGVASRCELGTDTIPDMPRKYLGPVSDAEWRSLLSDHLDRADEFRVHMPDGDGPLSYGRAEFMALPAVKVQPWSGMRDAVEITGAMTSAAKALLLRIEVSIESFDPEHKLWDYELVENGTVVLSIGDYHDLQVDVPN